MFMMIPKKHLAYLFQKLKNKPEIVENPHLLSSNPIDIIVVEAASQDAVRDDCTKYFTKQM